MYEAPYNDDVEAQNAFPNARLRALAGQTHDVNPETWLQCW